MTVLNDDKGKLHEILLGSHIHPDKNLPNHHRDEFSSPTTIVSKLKERVGDEFVFIDSNSERSACCFIQYMDHPSIKEVYWTSNRDTITSSGDHEKTTGIKDINSNADLIIVFANNGYHGISAKYGKSKKPNFKNSGIEELEKISNVERGSFSIPTMIHSKKMEYVGYVGTITERHILHKIHLSFAAKGIENLYILRDSFEEKEEFSSKDKTFNNILINFINEYEIVENKESFKENIKLRLKIAKESSIESRKEIAKCFSDGLSKKNCDELVEIIKNNVSPKTIIPHTIIHTHVKPDGSSEPIITSFDDILIEKITKFDIDSLHIVQNSVNVSIKGKNVITGKIGRVAFWGFKTQSGPHKNVLSTFNLG